MTTYFDPTATADLALVLKAVRGHTDELVAQAAVVEADVIDCYTVRQNLVTDYNVSNFYVGRGFSLGNGYYVALDGFHSDASSCTNAALSLRLKLTIADVLSWRLAKYGDSPLVSGFQQTAGGSKTLRDGAKNPFPDSSPEWDWRLKRFDLRTPLYSI